MAGDEMVVGRGGVPLRRTPVFTRAGWTVMGGDDVSSGWQMLRCRRPDAAADPPSLLRDLVAFTRGPACVISLHEEGYALVRGLAPAGCWWEAWLNPDLAAVQLTEVPDDIRDPALWLGSPAFTAAVARKRAALHAGVPDDARAALAWSRAAGLTPAPDPTPIATVLHTHAPHTDDLVPLLLTTLGLPPLPARRASVAS
ncbi:hypothetical protein [Actinacidiphila acididurans]|uniref:Uncharacterized protein n=1 Tax=Actinacidiphila acididurans TaxID=2784346 RepID=A0ABS2TYI6_9ACTN|nr:hypothetical protein [Actinacidiphila acididurans]MBM9508152.1 hypothetical protein [Actinacidiphila acididurans]